MRLDLSDLSSIRQFASEFLDRFPYLDVLINNAGVMNAPQGKTKDGFETQFGINHLGHFELTRLLLPRLHDTVAKRREQAGQADVVPPTGRVVNISSAYHHVAWGRRGEIAWDDPNFDRRPYDGWAAYAQSKLANIIHASEIGRRDRDGRPLPDGVESPVIGVSVHPGFVRTNLMRHTVSPFMARLASPFLKMIGRIEPWEGIQATLAAVLGPAKNGDYFSQASPRTVQGGFPREPENPLARQGLGPRLWELSERLISEADSRHRND